MKLAEKFRNADKVPRWFWNRGTRIYVVGWAIFCGMTVALALSARTVVNQNQKAIQSHIQAHLDLILDGTVAVLDAQLVGVASHMEDAIHLIETHLTRPLVEGQQQEFLDLLKHDLRSVPARAVGFKESSGKVSLDTPDLVSSLRRIQFDGSQFESSHQFSVEMSLPFRSETGPGDAKAETLWIMWRGRSEKLRAMGIEEIYAFTDGRQQMAQALQPGRSGTTGELYAFDRNGWMISDSRFNEHLYQIGLLQGGQQAAMRVRLSAPSRNLLVRLPSTGELNQLSKAPLTLMAQNAIQGTSGVNVEGYADYRGVPVVGAWIWLKRYGFGITHEVDHAEAYAHIGILNWTFLTLIGLLFTATIALGFISWRAGVHEAKSEHAREKIEALQRDIHHTNRINTLGQLATGMAHELNQPLTTIVNFARALLVKIHNSNLEHRGEIEKQLTQIEKNATLSGDIIKRMRSFLRSDQVAKNRLSLRKLVKDSYQLLEHEMTLNKIRFNLEPGADHGWILGDEVQLQRVLLNLMKNAIEATQSNAPNDRTLTVRIQGSFKEDSVILEVFDNGPGIAPEIKDRVFEQFVTTKPGGMGLGLAICESIVETHQGSIQLMESERGAHFILHFPRSQDEHSRVYETATAIHS